MAGSHLSCPDAEKEKTLQLPCLHSEALGAETLSDLVQLIFLISTTQATQRREREKDTDLVACIVVCSAEF